GLGLLEDIMENLRKTGSKQISGRELFRLYDTYGFPVELTEEIAAGYGFELNKSEFESEMQKQRERARAAFTGYEAANGLRSYSELAQNLPVSKFVGYTELMTNSRVLGILKDGLSVDSAGADADIEVILDITPFYAAAGGQIGDKGTLSAEGVRTEVYDVIQPVEGLTVHKARLKQGKLVTGQIVRAQVEESLRRDTAAHHSGTHLLQSALREVLGPHVYQAGSLVGPDKFRFDYAHFAALDRRQLQQVEALVNRRIRENIPVDTMILPFDKAKQMGAIALFGEKYGDEVRVVKMGSVSMELCGGTHVRATGDIGLFLIVSESSIAAGMRRIEAVCGSAACRRVREDEDLLDEFASTLNAPRGEMAGRILQLLEERKKLEKDLARLKSAIVSDKADDMLAGAVDVDGIKVLAVRLDDHDATYLRKTADSLKAKLKSGVVVIGGVSEGKVLLIAGVTADLTSKVHAGDLVKAVARIVGGGGGGRADMAQAGGKDPSKLQQALEEVPHSIERMVKSA
ncbi:MAG: alanine--tRNA ligase, partial [Candidatus Lindowbacteria bacterium]|nr:alanine--tRNA ligase [Candidatus Lindowbacteria bacterium]